MLESPAMAYRYPDYVPRRKRRYGCLARVRDYLFGLFGGFALVGIIGALIFWFLPPAHTNIVLLGLDRRPGESMAARTDTMILVGVDGRAPAVTMMSIPRDLWVTLADGRGENRINTAHFFAEAEAAGTGPKAALDTVELNFGVQANHYVRVDFDGFERIIDSVGGVVIDVEYPFVDYEYPTDDGGTTVVEFQAGEQRMSGERALQYARIRHGSSDFVRAARQQQVITAFVRQLLNPTTWPRLPLLFAAVTSAADTNISPVLMLRLAPVVLRVGPDGLNRIVMESPMVQAYTTSSGASVQLPVWEVVEPTLIEHFGKR